MTPVGYGFTMLEAAITNCLYYGVDSIWITVNDDELPWAKKCVGQLGYDPVRYIDRFSINKTDQRKRVPIYFVPTFSRYRDYCDNYTFGFINAGLMAKKVYGHVSSYCEPDYYFFSSPFGLLDPEELREKRSSFKSGNKKSLFYFAGQTALDGVHLPMCIDKEQLEKLKKNTLSLSTGKSRSIAVDAVISVMSCAAVPLAAGTSVCVPTATKVPLAPIVRMTIIHSPAKMALSATSVAVPVSSAVPPNPPMYSLIVKVSVELVAVAIP